MKHTQIDFLKNWWKTLASGRTLPFHRRQRSLRYHKHGFKSLENREPLTTTVGIDLPRSSVTEGENEPIGIFRIDCSEPISNPDVMFQISRTMNPTDDTLQASTDAYLTVPPLWNVVGFFKILILTFIVAYLTFSSHLDAAALSEVYTGGDAIPTHSSSAPLEFHAIDPAKSEATLTIREETTVTLTTIDPIALEPCAWISGNDRKGAFRLTVETTETNGETIKVTLNISGSAEAGENGLTGDYHLTTNPNGGSPSDIIPVSNGEAIITIPPGQSPLDFYVMPNGDHLFEEDEEVILTIAQFTKENEKDSSDSIKNIKNNADSVVILQAPEFLSDIDANSTNNVNSDHYEMYINPNEEKFFFREGVSIKAVTPKNRSCQYAFYDSENGNSSSSGVDPLLTIDKKTGEITVKRNLNEDEMKSSLRFTIKVYDSVYNQLYDLATLTIVPIIVDLDIDSDNTYLGTKGLPNRSSEEDLFENDEYAPGKIMKPNWGDTDLDGVIDCWDGYSNGGSNHKKNGSSPIFYPIVLQIPDKISLSEASIRLNYRMASLTVSSSNIEGRPVGEGTIRIWKKDGCMARNGLSIKKGGDLVLSSEGYTPSQLGFTNTKRTIILYVEAVTENKQDVEKLRKDRNDHKQSSKKCLSETTIKFSVTIKKLGTFEDEVKYVVSNTGSFYYELMTHPELMSAYASEAIYDYGQKDKAADRLEYGLKKLDGVKLRELGIDGIANTLLSGKNLSSGFKAGIYREYITGKYILSFAGTDSKKRNDWITDFQQAFGTSGVVQYKNAEVIANAIISNPHFTRSNMYITGHSLGGGLASAASIISEFHAYTFNAAGLHPNSVDKNPNLAKANQLIDAYYADWDLLHGVQLLSKCLRKLVETSHLIVAYAVKWNILRSVDSLNDLPVPAAIGTQIKIRSDFGSKPFALLMRNSLIAPVCIGGVMCTECHKMSQVIYGMEHRILSGVVHA